MRCNLYLRSQLRRVQCLYLQWHVWSIWSQTSKMRITYPVHLIQVLCTHMFSIDTPDLLTHTSYYPTHTSYHHSPTFPMANNSTGKTTVGRDKITTWSRNDKGTLVCALKKAKEDTQWGDNNPKEVAWTACVAALSSSEKVLRGVAKDSKAIKRRWQCVCIHHIWWIVCAFTILSSVETRIWHI